MHVYFNYILYKMLKMILNKIKLIFLVRNKYLIIKIILIYYNFLKFYNRCIELTENKIINQKFYYSDVKKYNKNVEIYEYTTVGEIDINNKDKNKIENYLKERKISIKYFENFKGYIFLVTFESFTNDIENIFKGIYLFFLNNNMKKKAKIKLFILNLEDVQIILLILNKYLRSYRELVKVGILNKILSLKNLNFNKNEFFFNVQIEGLDILVNYLKQYKRLLNYIIDNNLFLTRSNKNCLYVRTNENSNIDEMISFFTENNYLDLFEQKKDYFLKFNGLIYLVEIEASKNNKKLKRFSVVFYNLNLVNNQFYYLHLIHPNLVCFIISLFNSLFTDNSGWNLEISKLKEIEDIVLSEDYSWNDIIVSNSNLKINKKPIAIVNIDNYQNFMFFLEHFSLFPSNDLS